MAQSAWTLRTSSRPTAKGGMPAIDRKALASARRKRSIGTSPVVPCTRWSAISRVHSSRCASNADQLSNPRAIGITIVAHGTRGAAGNRVLLDVTDAALVLPLRARPIGCAGPRPKPPVPGEGMQSDIELDLAGLAVVPDHQPSIVVEQHLFGDAAEVAERTFQPGEPAFLALVAEGPDIQPTRIAERGDEQVHLDALVADRRPALAEVDLQLLARAASRSEPSPVLPPPARAAAVPLRARPCADSA